MGRVGVWGRGPYWGGGGGGVGARLGERELGARFGEWGARLGQGSKARLGAGGARRDCGQWGVGGQIRGVGSQIGTGEQGEIGGRGSEARLWAVGSRGPDGGKGPDCAAGGTVWHETLASHQSGILHTLMF